MKQKILFISPLASRSGYGDHAREIAEYLCKWSSEYTTAIKKPTKRITEYDANFAITGWGSNPMNALDNESELTKEFLSRVTLTPNPDEYDVCIHLGMPSEFKALGKYNIGITAGVETDICPVSFLVGCNKMDLVIVPSEFTRETLLSSTHTLEGEEVRCTTHIEVIPEIVDDIFYYENTTPTQPSPLDIIEEDFCFLFVGQWITSTTDDGGRKNLDSLIKTFIKTFHTKENQPALVLKTNGTNFSYTDRHLIQQKIKSITEQIIPDDSCPSIYLIHGELTTEEMSELYNHPKIKCNVSHTRGEGFGRPLLEASLSGNPVIAPKWSGHLDFLTKKHSVLLPGKLFEVGVTNEFFCDGAKWFSVDEHKSSELMQEVFSNYDKYSRKAKQLSEINLEKYSKESVFDLYDTIFNTYMPPTPQEVELKLPTIEKI